jgi:hypothetical protein
MGSDRGERERNGDCACHRRRGKTDGHGVGAPSGRTEKITEGRRTPLGRSCCAGRGQASGPVTYARAAILLRRAVALV